MSNLQRINQDMWINPAGYCNRIDPTNINERFLTAGSQNVLIENLDSQTTRVMTRYGYKRCGTVPLPSTLNYDPVYAGSYKWDDGFDTWFFVAYKGIGDYDHIINIYSFKNTPCNYVNDGTTSFNKLSTFSLPVDKVRFSTIYDTFLQKKLMLIVYGDNRIGYFDGSTWNFVIDPLRQDTNYPNPTPPPLFFLSEKSPITPPADYSYDYITVYKNQVYIGSKSSRSVYVSKCVSSIESNEWNDFGFTVGNRIACEGGHILLDTNCRGFGNEGDTSPLQIYGENDYIYDVTLEQVQNSTISGREDIIVTAKKISSGQGAYEQELIANIKNGTVYLTQERTVDILSQVENFTNTQATPINDVVQIDFDNANLLDAELKYHKRNLYFMFPKDTRHLIYNLERGMWQPPQVIDIAGMLVHEDKLYGYQYLVDDKDGIGVFRMDCYNGYNKENIDLALTDDGAGYTCRIVTPYTHLGVRHHRKYHNSIFVEGYISANSIIKVKCLKDYGGYGGIQEKDINGVRQERDKVSFIKDPVDTVSLGKSVLGSHSLGNDNPYLIPKFHHVLTFSEKNSYYERQIQFEGEQLEQRWGIISYSTNVGTSSDTNFDVTK